VAQRGQILLVVVLLMVVVLTLGLSLATRNITNLRQSADEDHSQRAFSAAEAGIQIALQGNQSLTPVPFGDKTTYQTTIASPVENEFFLNTGRSILPNESADIWLATPPAFNDTKNVSLQILWGDANQSDPCNTAALEIAVITGSKDAPIIKQYAYDPCVSHNNKFTKPDITTGMVKGKPFKYQVIVPVDSGIMTRIIPLYKSTVIGVNSGSSTLPSQGQVIESTGSSGETKRKIVVYQGYARLPLEFFPNTIFIPSQL
jgi:hypothetical protein